MRSFKLASAILAAAALLALGTAGAASAHAPRHLRNIRSAGPCRISLNVAPRLVTSGETTLAFGRAICPGTEASQAGQTVTLYERSAGSPGYSEAGTATTEAHGFYEVATAPQTANSLFYAAIGSSNSATRLLKVSAQVTLVGPPESKSLLAGIKTGRRNAVTFTGEVSPEDRGATVVLQRQNAIRGNEWHRIGLPTVVNSSGKFAITHVFVVPGASNIRVMVRPDARFFASPSNVLSYQISQAQNPSLTILSETDPLAYGGSTVISGTVAGAPNTTVTLLGHAAHLPMATITTTKTDAEGKYAFPAQSPTTSMSYRVTGAGRSSAVLYQGVKYVLTASIVSSSVPSGSPVTFNGTITPARSHTIYLERENISGTSFHVIATGTVNEDGTYTISHDLYAPGTEVLRVKIPGDPENGGTASAPVTVTVTPLPASRLLPEPPANTSPPSEGTV
jgi:hypothetical protein